MQTLTKIYRNTVDKEGNPLVTQDGRDYERVSIKTQQYGDKYISGFGNPGNKNWKIGDTVDIIVEQKGQYLNFRMPNKQGLNNPQIVQLLTEIRDLIKKVVEKAEIKREDPDREPEQDGGQEESSDDGEINVEEIPF